ncbi:hypothetical protein HIC20_02900 [Buchnera aphidicola (Hormaphis cornu)]|nr:hypothetical protein HIC20_02900 [Buchnera aphidicola (Hormaphis cornu)]
MQKVVKKDAKLEDDSNINKLLRLSNISNYITVIIVSLIIAIIVSIFFLD